MSDTGVVLVSRSGHTATISLNRPDAKNALNMEVKAALASAISSVANDPDVRCVVVTGVGDAFCAGGDIAEMALNDTPATSRSRLEKLLNEVTLPLAEMQKPTIAVVNGHAHGAGFSLALACDIIVASDDAVFSCAFAKVGLLPDCGSMYFLPRRVPMGVAKELIYTGRRFTAEEAQRMGVVNTVVAPEELARYGAELAASLGESATLALGISKSILDQSLQSSLREIAALEAYGQAVLYASEDHLAARTAFLSKSRPEFVGR